jgi:SAM-dependent methyltransferase
MISDDWKVIDMLGITSNLNIDRTSPIPFTPSKDSLAIIEPHRRRPYITIHHGFDLNHLPSKTLSTTYGSTKNISTELWGEIVREVSELGLDVVQLGTTSEETLPGVRYVYNGQTSFSETAMLIKNAVCHIDTEGGLVHLARAMHTRSIVMFGPTPVEVFGYHENINFEPSGCKACWYSTQNWIVQCPRQTKGPECMTEHRSENVLEAVRRIILERGNLSLDLINRVRDDDESNASISNPIDALIASLKLTDRRLLVVADSSSDVQAKRLAPYGFDVEFVVTDPKESWAITETSTHIASTPIVASPYNLPQESGSVDVVIASLQAWRDDERGQVLRELCRVLRNEGIILGVPSPSDQPFDLLSMLDEGGFPIGERGALTAAHPNYFLLRFRRSFGQAGKLSSHSDNQAQQSGVARSTPDGGLLARLERDIQAEKDRIRLDLTEVYDLVTAREDVDDKIWAAKDTIGRLRSGLDGWIEFTSIVLDIDAMALLAENWQIPEPWGVWGAGARHTLLLPAPRGIADGQSLEVQIAFNLLPLQDQPTRFVTVRIGATEITKIACTEYENKETFFIRSEDFLANGGARLEFDVEKGIVPAAIMANSIDYRSLGLGLVRLRYKVV